MSDNDNIDCDGDGDLSNPDLATIEHLKAMAQYIQRETKCRTVQIHITLDLPGGASGRFAIGRGNTYERIGACAEWLKSL